MKLLSLIIVGFLFFTLAGSSHAQGLSLIRDTEIETILKKWSKPLFQAAGMSDNQVNIILVDSSEINAFVAGGSNIFIYAGLIQKAEYPEEVIGVIAHELGHISGGHLIAGRKAMEKASYQSILATVLGVGAAVATGDSRAAGAISIGGSGMAQSGFFAHSRAQESAADQAALKYLESAEQNPQGLVSFLEKLRGQELLPSSQQNEYMRTHPLTRDRIETAKINAEKSVYAKPVGESAYQNDFNLMKAKLLAFREPNIVPRYYPADSQNQDSLYANAIMHYRQSHYDVALKLMDTLISQSPSQPYFLEMKAQILRDSGRLKESESYYRKALKDLPLDKSGLMKISLAHVMIEQQKNSDEIEDLLTQALQSESRDSHAYRLLATHSGRNGKEADAQYYLAEEATLQRKTDDGKRFVTLALQSGQLSPQLNIKANDLKIHLERLLNDDK